MRMESERYLESEKCRNGEVRNRKESRKRVKCWPDAWRGKRNVIWIFHFTPTFPLSFLTCSFLRNLSLSCILFHVFRLSLFVCSSSWYKPRKKRILSSCRNSWTRIPDQTFTPWHKPRFKWMNQMDTEHMFFLLGSLIQKVGKVSLKMISRYTSCSKRNRNFLLRRSVPVDSHVFSGIGDGRQLENPMTSVHESWSTFALGHWILYSKFSYNYTDFSLIGRQNCN